ANVDDVALQLVERRRALALESRVAAVFGGDAEADDAHRLTDHRVGERHVHDGLGRGRPRHGQPQHRDVAVRILLYVGYVDPCALAARIAAEEGANLAAVGRASL